MVECPTANRNTSVGLLTRQSREVPTPHAYPEERARGRSCVLTKNGAASGGSSVRIARFAYDDPGMDQKKVSSHAMRNEVVSSSREVAALVIILPESPSALVFPRLFLPLVLSMSASLEEARIG
jgi:hypothetical protein